MCGIPHRTTIPHTHTHMYEIYEIKINFGAILILRSNKNHILILTLKLVRRILITRGDRRTVYHLVLVFETRIHNK